MQGTAAPQPDVVPPDESGRAISTPPPLGGDGELARMVSLLSPFHTLPHSGGGRAADGEGDVDDNDPHTSALCVDTLEVHWGCAEATAAAARLLSSGPSMSPSSLSSSSGLFDSLHGAPSVGAQRGVLLLGTGRHLLSHVAVAAALAAGTTPLIISARASTPAAAAGSSAGSPPPSSSIAAAQLMAVLRHVLESPPPPPPSSSSSLGEAPAGGRYTLVLPADVAEIDAVLELLQLLVSWPTATAMLSGAMGYGRRQASAEVRGGIHTLITHV